MIFPHSLLSTQLHINGTLFPSIHSAKIPRVPPTSHTQEELQIVMSKSAQNESRNDFSAVPLLFMGHLRLPQGSASDWVPRHL